MIVEFVGMPGAGKTVLVKTVAEVMQAHGLEVFDITDAGVHCLKKMWLGRSLTKIIPTTKQDWVLVRLFLRLLKWYQALFILKQPHLIWQVGHYLLTQDELTRADKWAIWGWFVRDIGYYQFFQGRLTAQQVILLEEGLIQRSSSIYTLFFTEPNPSLVNAYTQAIPQPDLVIWVKTSFETALNRLLTRGEARRYLNENVNLFMKNTATVLEIAMQTAYQLAWDVVVIDNNDALPITESQLRDAVTTHLTNLKGN